MSGRGVGRRAAAARRGWIVATATAAATTAALAGCAAAAPGAGDGPLPPGLVGTTWRAETIAGQPVADGAASTLSFLADGRVAGLGGCNRYAGTIRAEDGRLRVGPLAATRMACDPALMDQEARFFAALEGTARLRRDGGFLLLEPEGAGEPSRLAPDAEAAPPPATAP